MSLKFFNLIALMTAWLAFSAFALAQSEILFSKTYDTGDSESGWQLGWQIHEVGDDGYIVLGHRGSIWGNLYCWILRVDASGDTLWTKSLGGVGEIAGYDLSPTEDSGYIFTGVTTSDGGATLDVWLVHIDSQGETLWTRSYSRSDDDEGLAVTQTSDRGYVVAGFTYGRDLWLIATDSLGNALQTRIYAAPSQSFMVSNIKATDTGFLLSGHISSLGGNERLFLMMIDSNLDTLWTREFMDNQYGLSYPKLLTVNNGYTIGSKALGEYYNSAVFLLGTDLEGNELYRRITAPGVSFSSLTYTHNGEIMLCGVENKAVFIRYDSEANPIWKCTINSDSKPVVNDILESSADTFLAVGSKLGIWLVSFSYDSSEAHLDTAFTDTSIVGDDTTVVIHEDYPPNTPRILAAIPDSGQVTLTWRENTESDFLLYRIYSGTAPAPTALLDSVTDIKRTSVVIKDLANGTAYYFRLTALDTARKESDFSNEVSAIPGVVVNLSDRYSFPIEFELHQNYPNPFNPNTTLRFDLPAATEVAVAIFDIMGWEVARLVDGNLHPGYHQVIWNGRDESGRELPSGLYIARLFIPPTAGVAPEYTQSIKMLLLK